MISLDTTDSRKSVEVPATKRLLDVSMATTLLLIGFPVLVLIASSVAISSRGPVFFFQKRVGHRGKVFSMIKFRSMYQDAEHLRGEIEHMSDREGLCLKIKRDPRITAVGRFLRRWSLDELPQLINVLKGDMSLVGPRPALVSEVALYPQHAHVRHSVLPGITGLWQISGRAEVGFEEMIELDLKYVHQSSLKLDLTILTSTLGAVIGGKGAY